MMLIRLVVKAVLAISNMNKSDLKLKRIRKRKLKEAKTKILLFQFSHPNSHKV